MATKKKKKSGRPSKGQGSPQQRQKAPVKGPLLSIGMIFRDDIRCIERCLKALQPLRDAIPCELVMGDTGSVDGSRAVAERYADVLIDFPWVNDFSAARNAVMDKCRGFWYMTVDTDEYLDPDFDQLADFLTDPAARRHEYGFVIVRSYATFDMLEGDYSDFYAPRLCRMATGWRYYGSIHESFPATPRDRAVELAEVVFHHDGYANEKNMKKKGGRNLKLLEQELEKEPGSMHRVIQCMESAHMTKDVRKYALMAQELLGRERDEQYSMAAYVDMISCAGRHSFPELTGWAAQGRERHPNSIRIALAASYYCAAHYAQIEEPERCLEELELYWAAVKRFDAGDFDSRELHKGQADPASARPRQVARVLRAEAYLKLKRWEEALSCLEELHPDKLIDDSLLRAIMNLLLRLWKESETDPRPLLGRWLGELEEDASDKARLRREGFLTLCRKAFEKPEEEDGELKRPAHLLFAALGEDRDLGRAGLILDSEDHQEVRRLLDAVEDWQFFPPEAVDHALKLGASLPDSFWRVKGETLSMQAAGLSGLRKEEPEALLKLWDGEFQEGVTPGQGLWLLYLANHAVQSVDWKKKGSLELFALFCDYSALYLEGFLHPAVCTEEYIDLQPPITRFGWYCVQARAARDGGDLVGYVRWLKKGLLAAPEMKEMVDFLSREARELAAREPEPSPELLALAEQVRSILAGFDPEDPAVAALKGSPAYQKVAHLLEGE